MSLDELYDAYWKELYAVAYRKLRNRSDVEDILQDIFLSLGERPTVLERKGSIRYYLHQSLRNKVIDFYRREATKKTFDVEWGWLFDDIEAERTDNLLLHKELSTMIQTEVAAMPERMKHVYQLSREQHLEHSEIANRLGISVQTVKNQLGVALRRLRGALEDYRTYSLLAGVLISFFLE